MPKLYACCNDPQCHRFQAMVLRLQTWELDCTPRRENDRTYFDAAIPESWDLQRRARFTDVIRRWPRGH